MTTNNFHYAMSLCQTLYDIDLKEEDFEEIALIAWNQIGNKRCKLYRYSEYLNNYKTSIHLPCNCDIIEAVVTDFEDFQHVSNINQNISGFSGTEQYIESKKSFKSPLYISGKYIPYERVGDMLYFDKAYPKIFILYKGIILDNDGLPEINDKEALAIATYCAYITKFKEGIKTNNPNIIQLADRLKKDWQGQCDQARVPEEVSQNEWDEILDAKNSWDRKIYTRTYKPIR